MSASDTQTLLFTQVPRRIVREWLIAEEDISRLVPNHLDITETSLIESVTLTIQFRDMIATEEQIMTEEHDFANTRKEVWKSAMNLFSDLNKVVSDRIRELSKATLESAKENRAGRVELVKHTKTQMLKVSSASSSPTVRNHPFHPSGSEDDEDTIQPNDSASHIRPRKDSSSSSSNVSRHSKAHSNVIRTPFGLYSMREKRRK